MKVKRAPFDERYVAFVDILGFRNIVKRMSREPALFNLIRDTLDSINEQARHFQRYRRRGHTGARSVLGPIELQMTAFSDCYVVSDTKPAWHVVAAVQALGSSLLAQGIASRGAVVRSQAYHKGRALFGPAIIEAYELEQNVAKYPRILVSEAVRRSVWGYHRGLWKGELLRRDIDGCCFINVLMPSQSGWTALAQAEPRQSTRRFLNNVRSKLEDHLSRETDDGNLSKWRWLAHWFNQESERVHVAPIEFAEADSN